MNHTINGTPHSDATAHLFKFIARQDLSVAEAIAGIHELVEKGADLKACTWFGSTPLTWAACNDRLVMVTALLAMWGIDVKERDKDGNTALILAARNKNLAMAEVVLEASGVDVNARNHNGQTPFVMAVLRRDLPLVKKFAATRGVDVNAQYYYGLTPLMWAVETTLPIFEAVLAAPKVNVNAHDKDGLTALIMATGRKEYGMVRSLLAVRGIDVNHQESRRQETALMIAVLMDDKTLVADLAAAPGTRFNLKNCKDETALMIARRMKNPEIIQLVEIAERESAAEKVRAPDSSLVLTAGIYGR